MATNYKYNICFQLFETSCAAVINHIHIFKTKELDSTLCLVSNFAMSCHVLSKRYLSLSLCNT